MGYFHHISCISRWHLFWSTKVIITIISDPDCGYLQRKSHLTVSTEIDAIQMNLVALKSNLNDWIINDPG